MSEENYQSNKRQHFFIVPEVESYIDANFLSAQQTVKMFYDVANKSLDFLISKIWGDSSGKLSFKKWLSMAPREDLVKFIKDLNLPLSTIKTAHKKGNWK